MKRYMLDTMIFNKMKSDSSLRALFRDCEIIATHVQADELANTKDPMVRNELLSFFKNVVPKIYSTSTAIWDDSKWDQSCWSDNDGKYEIMLAKLKELDKKEGKRPKDPLNQSRDTRIAETAIKSDIVLITDDNSLSDLTRLFGGVAFSLDEYRKNGCD
jgi:predicted nuclease of predicted toxin-antitoxin system